MRFDRSLLTGSFLGILGLAFLGFATEYVLRPVIPLLILDRGGDATLIGLITAVYALPPILLRPMIGRVADMWSAARVLRIGTLLAAISPAGLLIPGVMALVPTRLSQGTAWALWNVATRTLMARDSPPHRRGAASGYFLAMPAVAVLVAPGVGVALYLATGVIGPTLVAIGLAAVALAITVRVAARAADPSAGVTGAAHDGILGWLVEPSALPAMLMTAMFMAADALFTVFPPVYLAIAGDPVELLALYYPAYGLVMAVSHFGAGHVSDRLGRGFTIRMGCVLGAIGLAIALLGEGIVFFGMGAGIYAVATALVSPALNALSIDRAPAHRLGSAMATYSIGYQLAIGGGSVVWGQLITAAGFDAAFAAAILLVLLTLAASYRYGGGRSGRASPPLVGSVDQRGT